MVTKKKATTTPDQFQLTFKREGLNQLKALADKYGIPEEELGEVVMKGLKALQLPKNSKITFNRGGETYYIELKDL